jgi:hypothetical protein
MPHRLIGLLVTLTLGLLMAPFASDTQPPGHIPVVGVLDPGPDSRPPRACLHGFA